MGFWTGAILGAIGGAAYGMLTAPEKGEDARSNLLTSAEERLASMTGMEIWTPGESNTRSVTTDPLDSPYENQSS